MEITQILVTLAMILVLQCVRIQTQCFAAYPHLSGYATFNNNPIYFNDPTGYEPNEGVVVYADKYVNPKAGGGKDLGTNILNGAKNSLIVLGGIVNSIVSNSFTFSDKNIVNLDNFKVSDETKHYFKVGEEEGHKLTITIAAFETAVGIYEEATGTFLLPFTEGVSGLVIAKGYLLNAHGVFATTNAVIKLQNMNSVGNTSGGDHKYFSAPDNLKAFPDAKTAKKKTNIPGVGLRARWKDSKGRIYEWDSKKGEVEIYDKTGKHHMGGFDPNTGKLISTAKKIGRWNHNGNNQKN